MADYVGSRFAVAVDSCTNALFLCCKWHKVEKVIIPRRTYVSVPMTIMHAGGTVWFDDRDWLPRFHYQLKPYPIIDSALQLSAGMHVKGQFDCVSFSANKPINIGKGGMIFHDDPDADWWFRRARYMGRGDIPVENDQINILGWNMYMTPEQAARGLLLSYTIGRVNTVHRTYPDLTDHPLFEGMEMIDGV